MKYCKKCTMPDTRPGIVFGDDGVCNACKNYDRYQKIDWDKRYEELKQICDKYRGCNGEGNYDCAIAVSGGKDSHFQVYVMKELMHMTPILFTVEDNFTMTEAGKANIRNISEEFGCTLIAIKPNIRTQKKLTRQMFERYGKPTWMIDRYLYTYPLHMALKFNTMLIVYGENISYFYGGVDDEDTYSARKQIENGVAVGLSDEELLEMGAQKEDLALLRAPSLEDIRKLDPVYLSYFMKWNSVQNFIFARSRGFRDLTNEWNRTHCAENFDQVDSIGYTLHAWLKYPKFGHAMATDYTARFVRYGMMTREEAIKIVKEHDHALDPKCIDDFCQFCGYTRTEFYNILETLYNRDIFTKNERGEWVLKNPIA